MLVKCTKYTPLTKVVLFRDVSSPFGLLARDVERLWALVITHCVLMSLTPLPLRLDFIWTTVLHSNLLYVIAISASPYVSRTLVAEPCSELILLLFFWPRLAIRREGKSDLSALLATCAILCLTFLSLSSKERLLAVSHLSVICISRCLSCEGFRLAMQCKADSMLTVRLAATTFRCHLLTRYHAIFHVLVQFSLFPPTCHWITSNHYLSFIRNRNLLLALLRARMAMSEYHRGVPPICLQTQ